MTETDVLPPRTPVELENALAIAESMIGRLLLLLIQEGVDQPMIDAAIRGRHEG